MQKITDMAILASFCNNPQYSTSPILCITELGKGSRSLEYTPVFLGYDGPINHATGLTMGQKFIFVAFAAEGAWFVAAIKKENLQPVFHQHLPDVDDIHSILEWRNKLYVVSTGTDSVVAYDIGEEGLDNPRAFWHASSAGRNTHHVNSIVAFNDDLIVSAFGEKRGELKSTAQNGYLHNISKDIRIKEGIFHPHSLSVKNGELFYCESGRGSFNSLGDEVINMPGYSRGITWLPNGDVCIGSSIGRKVSRSTGKIGNPADPGEPEGKCGISIVEEGGEHGLGEFTDFSWFGPEIYDLMSIPSESIDVLDLALAAQEAERQVLQKLSQQVQEKERALKTLEAQHEKAIEDLRIQKTLNRWSQEAKVSSRNLLQLVNICYALYKSKKFNVDWYLLAYEDVRIWSQDRARLLVRLKYVPCPIINAIPKILTHPIFHYVRYGVGEGRNPSPNFSTVDYLMDHEDILKAGLNPFYHYVQYGIHEHRKVRKARNWIGNEYSSSEKNIQAEEHDFRFSRFQTIQTAPEFNDPYKPLVSVIVPNYNHEDYLEQRLESIFSQTYTNYEVLLMDDCSKDNSRETLTKYNRLFPEKTTCIFNEENSGSVFKQWKKGLGSAKGELIWIAETDDFCDPNFLEELVAPFRDEAVLLSYARTTFVNREGTENIWEIEKYLQELDEELWSAPFIQTADWIVKYYFSIKNIIPNVSSCLFRNPGEFPLFSNRVWQEMRLCGDWLFYIMLIRGGLIAYTPDTTNYYRIHDQNASVTNYQNDVYYWEHQEVSRNIVQHYDVDFRNFERQASILRRHWERTRGEFNEEEFQKVYDLDVIHGAYGMRRPNLLMCTYAFSSGGGEVFPINLANMLSDFGFTVTFLSFDQLPRNDGVRKMLYPRIPVVNNFFRLNEILAGLNIQIIHSHHAWVDYSITNLAASEDVKHVVSLHGMYELIPAQKMEGVVKKISQNVDRFVVTAEKNKSAFIELNQFDPKRFVKIGNALGSRRIYPVDLADLGIDKDSFVITNVSRAIAEKGWEEAIKAVDLARKMTGVDIHLVLIGDGPEEKRLRKSLSRNSTYIHFLGFKDNIRDYFAASHIGLLSSKFKGESYPLVLIDCLSSGTPMIASNLGEIESMLEADGELAGSVFDLDDWEIDIKTLARIIADYVENEDLLRRKSLAVSKAVKKFDKEKVLKSYEELYIDLATGNG